jgi:hypothetical protein
MPSTDARGVVLRHSTDFPDRACEYCGGPLEGKRADARTCSPKCRKRLSRASRRFGDDHASVSRRTSQRCCCGPLVLATINPDGDRICAKCGRSRGHVRAPVRDYDSTLREMVTDGEGHLLILRARKRRRCPSLIVADALIEALGSAMRTPSGCAQSRRRMRSGARLIGRPDHDHRGGDETPCKSMGARHPLARTARELAEGTGGCR